MEKFVLVDIGKDAEQISRCLLEVAGYIREAVSELARSDDASADQIGISELRTSMVASAFSAKSKNTPAMTGLISSTH
jgi:hypothetical protein